MNASFPYFVWGQLSLGDSTAFLSVRRFVTRPLVISVLQKFMLVRNKRFVNRELISPQGVFPFPTAMR